nr:hypothetical protein [Tanacetum cinerariifolium]
MLNTNNTTQTQKSNALHNAIMEAGSKDRPPMLAPGNYVQWKSRIKRHIDTKPNHELINYCLQNPPYKYKWIDKDVPVTEGSPVTTTKSYMENYKNVLQNIRDQLNAEAEAIQIILTWIDNDNYSTVDACLNACEIWKAIEMLKQGESINVQDLETNLYWEFGKFTSQDVLTSTTTRMAKNQVNEIRAERLAHTTNPLALVAQQQPVYHPQSYHAHYTQNSSTRSQQAATRNRGKSIVNSPPTIYDQEPSMANDAAYHKEKMLLCKQEEAEFQLNAEQADWKDDTDDESEDRELEAHYMYMAKLQEVTPDAADNVQQVQNNDNYNVFAIESKHHKQSKSVHDTSPIEQDEHNVIINSLDMRYDREQIDQDDDVDDLDNDRELLASLIQKLKCEIDDSKKRNKFLETSNKALVDKLKEIKKELLTHQETISIISKQKEAQIKLYKTHEDKELDKVIALGNKVKVLDNIVYKTGQSVQTMNMLNRNCKTSYAKPEFLKKAQRASPRMYDIGCYNDNLALMLAPESDEVIHLEKESRSKLSDLIRPFDYDKLNNLYDLFVSQHEKSSTQRYFFERSRMSHTLVNNENSK